MLRIVCSILAGSTSVRDRVRRVLRRRGGASDFFTYEEPYPVVFALTSLARVRGCLSERPLQIFDLGFTLGATCA